ncbi:hypothetical protein GGS26DRAFT_412640 [Hypomontagnella submonticulosa]|nr:hypothetical protein GGS26DRAFT_412640 [Hypomontagnella submonticulosa]
MKFFSSPLTLGVLLLSSYTLVAAIPAGEKEVTVIESRDDYCTADKTVSSRALHENDTAIIEKRSGSGWCSPRSQKCYVRDVDENGACYTNVQNWCQCDRSTPCSNSASLKLGFFDASTPRYAGTNKYVTRPACMYNPPPGICFCYGD